MAFEAFMTAQRSRRARVRGRGLLASLGLHLAPVLALGFYGVMHATRPAIPVAPNTTSASTFIGVPLRMWERKYVSDANGPHVTASEAAPANPPSAGTASHGRRARMRRPEAPSESPDDSSLLHESDALHDMLAAEAARPLPDVTAAANRPRLIVSGAPRARPAQATVASSAPALDHPVRRPGSDAWQVPSAQAQGLRVYETYPHLPQALSRHGKQYPVMVEICVGTAGGVDSVRLEQPSAAELDDALLAAIKTWKYRPFTSGGVAQPFCHPLRVIYHAD